MGLIRTILGKLGAGILYGAGFFIGLSIIGIVAMPYFESSMKERLEESIEESTSSLFVDYDESAKLEVEVKSENIGNGEFTLIGELSNRGEESWSSVSLEAELYDESGAFIEECGEYITQTSRPGSTINFKLSCGSKCSALQIDQYASYKLQVVDAYHK